MSSDTSRSSALHRAHSYNRPSGGALQPLATLPSAFNEGAALDPDKDQFTYLPLFGQYSGPGIGQGAKPMVTPLEAGSASKPVYQPTTLEPIKPSRRRYCCCFSSRLRCICTLFLIIVLILIGIAVAVFFCYPRISNIHASQPILTSTNTPLISQTTNGLLVSFNLSTTIAVTSNSYVDYAVQRIDVTAKPVVPNEPPTDVTGYGTAYDVNIAKMSVSNFTQPISFSYTAASVAALDPTLTAVLMDCGAINGTTTKQAITIAYTASLYINWISWTSYRPSFSGTSSFDCANAAKAIGL